MVAYTMSKLCDVVDCLNTRRGLPTTATSADPRPVFYHALPLDEPRRTQWLNAVHFRKVKGRELRAPKVCSLHFAPSDYDVDHDPTLSQALGFSYMRPKLSATAVPSMTLRHQEQQGTSQDRSSVADDGMASHEPSTSVEMPAEEDVQMEDDDPHMSARVDFTGTNTAATQTDFPHDLALQPPMCGVGRDRAVQVCLSGRSIGVQVNTTLKGMVQCGVNTDVKHSPVTSTPVKRPRHDEPVDLQSPNVSPVRKKVDDSDTTYASDNTVGAQDDTLDDEDSIDDSEDPSSSYYLVSHTSLLMLLHICLTCLFHPCEVVFSFCGTCLTATTVCPNDMRHERKWTSQAHVGKKPKGNVDLVAAILFAGASPAVTLRVLQLMGVKAFSQQSFFNYQRAYLLPAVHMVWDEEQKRLLELLMTDPVELCGDARCDSPGFSAKFLTYSFLCPRLQKIVHIQVKESDTVTASTNMEKEGLIRGLAFPHSAGISLASLTTDRHSGIKKHMRVNHGGILHYFDVWHVAKDSPAYKKIKNIVTAPFLLKDIRQISPRTQTYSLESFHSVFNGFAPKSAAFTYESIKARTLIAALHFNENSERRQGQTKDDVLMWHVKTSKARQGATSVSPLMAATTFVYVQNLRSKVTELCMLFPTFEEALKEVPDKVPPAFSPSAEPGPSNIQRAAQQQARFRKP